MLSASPSKIARYFYHECERHLFFQSISRRDRKRVGIPEWILNKNPITTTIMQGGLAWEENVVKDLLKGSVAIAPAAGKVRLSSRHFSKKDTLKQLNNPKRPY